MALIPNRKEVCFETSALTVKIDDKEVDKITHGSGVVYSPYIPVMTISSVPIVAQTRKLKASFSLEPDTITFKHNDKSFAIYPKNKELAEKLVTLELKDWITYLQFDDEGIVQLVKYLCGMKHAESLGSETVLLHGIDLEKEMVDILSKEIAAELEKEMIDKIKNQECLDYFLKTKKYDSQIYKEDKE